MVAREGDFRKRTRYLFWGYALAIDRNGFCCVLPLLEPRRRENEEAKQEPSYRFYCLYDKICREDILAHAYEMAKANGGAPGMDRESFDSIESGGRGRWLAAVRKELIGQTYRPEPVRRVMIPKPAGGERPLGIPTIRDRVVQTATKLVIEP